ncbi:hypothetical protein [Nocardia sp. NPDC127526]|uniref:hypothetical protein n=1 Tax=Nocardia sp. NPDC127526 TaxID=3345393 RepID=UPI003631085E
MNSHEYARRNSGLSAYNRAEYDANGLLQSGFQSMPLRWRLPVFFGLVLFAAGIVVGIQLEQQTPTMPPSVNVCRAEEVDRIDCVHVNRQAPAVPGVAQ